MATESVAEYFRRRNAAKVWVKEHTRCDIDHECNPIVVRTYANETTHYVRQCGKCGRQSNGVKKSEYAGTPQPFDEDLKSRFDEYCMKVRDRFQVVFGYDHAVYERYLNGDEWHHKSMSKLDDAGHECEQCGGTAYECHHLHYDTIGEEQISDLMALCHACHMEIHGHD